MFVNSESFLILWSSFFSRKLCFLWSSCFTLNIESISLDTSHKTTSRITSICSAIWEEIDDILSFISLTTTSACMISDDMFLNNSINITFKWRSYNFFLKTLFCFFSSDFFLTPCQIDFSWVLNLFTAFIFIFFSSSSCILFSKCPLWMLVTVYKIKPTLWKHW